jgi:hypothetical protein
MLSHRMPSIAGHFFSVLSFKSACSRILCATGMERRCTWRRLLLSSPAGKPQAAASCSTPQHLGQLAHSAASTDTELTTLDTHELWLPDSSIPEPTPSTMTALHHFGAEMLRLSRGLESVAAAAAIGLSTPPAGRSTRQDTATQPSSVPAQRSVRWVLPLGERYTLEKFCQNNPGRSRTG